MKQFDIFNSNKVLVHHEAMAAIAAGRHSFPVTVSIDPSSACNQRCVWCSGRGYVNKDPNSLHIDVLMRLPDDCMEMNVKGVWFTGGGEPYMNPNLSDAIVKFRGMGIKVGVVTNAAMMDDRDCQIAATQCEFIRVSFDAGMRETYSALHGSDDFERALDRLNMIGFYKHNYGKAKSYDAQVGMSYLVHPLNYLELERACFNAYEAGADYIQFKPVVMGQDWLSDPRLNDYIMFELEMLQKKFDKKNFRVLSNFKRFRHAKKGYKRLYKECLGHGLIAVVMATGQLNICCQHRMNPDYAFGNLKKNSLAEIWQNYERVMVAKNINLKNCPTCKYESYNQMLWTMKYPPIHTEFL